MRGFGLHRRAAGGQGRPRPARVQVAGRVVGRGRAAQAAARRLGPLLGNLGDSPEVDLEDDPIDPPRLLYRYCVTGSASGFAKGATRWLERRPRVETVELRTPS